MSRTLKRVPIDFDWPLSEIWEGYVNPYHGDECLHCSGSGASPLMRSATDFWYHGSHHQFFGFPPGPLCENLTQELVNLLVDKGRLSDFSSEWIDRKWHRIKNDDGSLYYPPAPIINSASKEWHVHDALNEFIVSKHLVTQMGEPVECSFCKGEGVVWDSEERKAAYENWEETEPPEGDGWQVWETVSEGSPVTPVFPTAEALVDHLTTKGDFSTQRLNKPPFSRKAAEAFIKSGWAASGVIVNGKVSEGIETAKYQKGV